MKNTTDFNTAQEENEKQWNAEETVKYFMSDRDEEEENDEEEDDEENANSDWGTVDPLEHPGPPSDMDPTAPGSAV